MNYRELLLKYMRCCIECDGDTHLVEWGADPEFFERIGLSKAEYDELVKLAAEVQ